MSDYLTIERQFLSGLVKHPHLFSEVDQFINEDSFRNGTHRNIFAAIKGIISKGDKLDRVVLVTLLQNIGVTSRDGISISDYIEAMAGSPITEKGVIKIGGELSKIKFRRDLHRIGENLKELSLKSSGSKIEEIAAKADEIYSKKIDACIFDDKPVDIFDGLEHIIDELGNNPVEEAGLKTPYDNFNRLFGGLRKGQVHAVVARPGQGKTNFIDEICFGTAKLNNCKFLCLDTEMSTLDIQMRMIASISGVPYWYIETGNFIKDKEMTEKVNQARKIIRENKKFFHHQHVQGKPIEVLLSIIRRWYYSEVGFGGKCIIAYDYIKLTGENVTKNFAEYQVIGEKVNKLKELATELNAPLFTAMQMNRTGESQNKMSGSLIEDSSVISLTDRLQWFANLVLGFRRKVNDELALDGPEFGTHKLTPFKMRFQGRDATGHQDLVRRPNPDGSEGPYVSNYLNFNIKNFKVEDKGGLQDIIEKTKVQFSSNDDSHNPTNAQL